MEERQQAKKGKNILTTEQPRRRCFSKNESSQLDFNKMKPKRKAETFYRQSSLADDDLVKTKADS